MKVYTNFRMYAIRFTFLAFVICLPCAIYAFPDQKLLNSDDWAYEAISFLSREQGVVFFTDSRVTVTQMKSYLHSIDASALSESGMVIYERLLEHLNYAPLLEFQSDAASIHMDAFLQAELYYKANENNPWIFNDHSRGKFLQIPFGFSLGPWLAAEMELYLGEDERAASLNNNYSNFPVSASHIDIHTPKRAYLSAGYPFKEASGIHFALGLGDNFFGQTKTGSIIVSEYLQRVSFARLSVYSPAFKYAAEVTQYEVNKYQYLHYLQFKPHKSISISLAEGVMVNAPLELRYLNPFSIFHSFEAYKTYNEYNDELGVPREYEDSSVYETSGCSRVGSILGLKIEWLPVKNLRLYGLFVMNQYQLPNEKKEHMDVLTPDALGFQAGFNVSLPVSKGYWDFGLEGVYTYPFLYVLHHKKWSFYKEVHEVDYSDFNLRYWTGTPFGPDSIAGAVWAGFHSSANWYAGFSFVFSAQGERSNLTIFDKDDRLYRPSPDYFDITVPPTGDPIYTYTAALHGEYNLKKWLRFTVQPGYRVIHHNDLIEHGFEISLTVRFMPNPKLWLDS